MKPCKEIRRSFIEALYGELDQETKQSFHAHLESCIKCRKAFRKMKRAMGVMSQRVRVEPEPQFWEGYYERLEKRMQEKVPQPVVTKTWKNWMYHAAAVLLLVGIGVVLGRLWVPKESTIVQNPSVPQEAPIVQAKLEQRTQNFLGRSEVLLLGLVNYDPETEAQSNLDLRQQKMASQTLIQEATYLKKELKSSEDRRLEKLVTDLELILLQIANLEEQQDQPEIELVKDGVDRKGLLLKINLEQMRNQKKSVRAKSDEL